MNNLKKLRKDKGLTQQELAQEMETTKLTISNWEMTVSGACGGCLGQKRNTPPITSPTAAKPKNSLYSLIFSIHVSINTPFIFIIRKKSKK